MAAIEGSSIYSESACLLCVGAMHVSVNYHLEEESKVRVEVESRGRDQGLLPLLLASLVASLE